MTADKSMLKLAQVRPARLATTTISPSAIISGAKRRG